MLEMNSIGKTLVISGLILAVVGGIFMLGGKLSWFGRLPGDIYIEKKGVSFYFPITTSVVISLIVSVIFILLRRR